MTRPFTLYAIGASCWTSAATIVLADMFVPSERVRRVLAEVVTAGAGAVVCVLVALVVGELAGRAVGAVLDAGAER